MTLIIYILAFMFTGDCHKVYKVSYLNNVIQSESKSLNDFDTILPTNHALVFYLKSGRVILTPNGMNPESEGILFENKTCFQACIEKNYFPIKNENEQVQERYQDYLLNLNEKIDSIISHLAIKSGINNSYNGDLDFLSIVLDKVNGNVKKLTEKELFFSALALGEYLRKSKEGHWILLKRYGTFNPYYTPAIIYSDGSVLLFWDYLNSFFKNKGMTCSAFANLPYIKNPNLKQNSPFIINTFFEIKQLKNKL